MGQPVGLTREWLPSGSRLGPDGAGQPLLCSGPQAGAQTRCNKTLWLFQKREEEAMPTVRSTLAQELLYNPFLGVVSYLASWAFLWGRLGAYGRA